MRDLCDFVGNDTVRLFTRKCTFANIRVVQQHGAAMSMKRVFLLMAVLGLTGCATPYGTPSLAGGYNEYPVNRQLVKVNFSGNGYITSAKVQTYTLYRCAELARDARKPHFVIYDSLGAAARDRPADLPRVGALGGKPLAFAFLLMLDEPRLGSMATQDVLARLEPEVRPAMKKTEARP